MRAPSLIRPLGAYLPRPELAANVIAPPYDRLIVQETRGLVTENPLSFLNVLRSEIDAPERTKADRLAMLTDAAVRLRELLAGEIFDFYEPPVFFVCRLELDGRAQTGVVADVSLEAYEAGLVRVHESTRRGQEDRLVEYMNIVRASILPVFLIHRLSAAVHGAVAAAAAEAPVIDVNADDGLRMSVWVVDDPADVAQMGRALAGLEELYIADGHHRVAASRRSAAARATANPERADEPYTHVVSVLFSADQLIIHPYNRCVRDLGGCSVDELLAAIGSSFEVRELPRGAPPASPGEFSLRLNGRWYQVTAPARLREVEGAAGLDVAILHDHLLRPLLGIDDPRTDARIEFVPDTLGLGELERLCDEGYAVAFALHPMGVDELMDVADRGEQMPPKSTWFAPKLRSGLVIRLL